MRLKNKRIEQNKPNHLDVAIFFLLNIYISLTNITTVISDKLLNENIFLNNHYLIFTDEKTLVFTDLIIIRIFNSLF